MANVLVVDDSPTIRRMVKASLGVLPDIAFTEAANGLEAIEHLALERVALVILDLNMPDLHGLDVLRFLRGHRTYRDVPVIVLTTRSDVTSREAAMTAGASEYLTKPFTPELLATHARRLLSPTSTAATAG